MTFYFLCSGKIYLAVHPQLCIMFEVQHVPKNSSYLQMVAAEAKENIFLMNKKSSSLPKYSIQSVLFLFQYVCFQNIFIRSLLLFRIRLSLNVTFTTSKYSVAPKELHESSRINFLPAYLVTLQLDQLSLKQLSCSGSLKQNFTCFFFIFSHMSQRN